MAEQFARLTATLSQEPAEISDAALIQINRYVSAGNLLRAEDVHVAAMYIVSDQVNSFGGRFPSDEHPRLAELLIDSPVMVGHRKDQLPIGRNFLAELVDRSGERWVKCYFYWLKNSEGAESLKANIDGGIYRECSIAFTYNLPECSICRQDIRVCEHEPGERYQSGSGESTCHFDYRQVERVLETSLVYRGAVPNTLVTTEQTLGKNGSQREIRLAELKSIDHLESDKRYLVVPHYDAVPVIVSDHNATMQVCRFDGTPIPNLFEKCSSKARTGLRSDAVALLIGFQGKQRCSRETLEKYLSQSTGPVTRLTVAAYPDLSDGVRPLKYTQSRSGLRTLPYRLASGREIGPAIKQIATRDGVEIWPLDADPCVDIGYHFNPNRRSVACSPANRCRIEYAKDANRAILSYDVDGHVYRFAVKAFDLARFSTGRAFLIDDDDSGEMAVADTFLECVCDQPVSGTHKSSNGIRLEFQSPNQSCLLVRSAVIGGRRRRFFRQALTIGGASE